MAAGGTAETPQVAEPAQARVTTTTERNRWPLYAVGVVALLVLAVLLVAHPWTDDTPSDGGTTPGADTVRVRAAAYIGDPVEEVEAALADKGLKTKTNEIDNSGDHDAGTVADLDPTGRVKKGSTITLDVWAEPSSDNSDEDEGDNKGDNKGQDKKTKAPKPDKTEQPAPGGQSIDPGNTDTGDVGGASSSAAPAGRAPSESAEPNQGPKGD
jgi:serine/threonine-protein kinase